MRAALLITAGIWAAGAGISANAAAPEGDGFNAPEGAAAWSRWQTRVVVGVPSPSARFAAAGGSPDGAGLKYRGLRVMGDYYFSPSLAARPAGFRATSGLLLGSRSSLSLADGAGFGGAAPSDRANGGLQPAWAINAPDMSADSATVPYLGIGYTGASAKGGLSFSADLGLIGVGGASAVKLGRGAGASPSLDDTLREMRLSPVLQLGVSYSF